MSGGSCGWMLVLLVACSDGGKDDDGGDDTLSDADADADTDADSDSDSDTDSDADTDTDTDSDADTDTDTGLGTPVDVASCSLTANTLRVACDATLLAEGPATLELSASGAPTRRFVSGEDALEHSFTGWGLRPDTTYDWTIGDASGTVATGSIPSDLATAGISVTGSTDAFDAVLRPYACSGTTWMVLVDPEGNVVWYEETDLYKGGRTGYDWDDEGPAVVSADAGRFERTEIDGTVSQTLLRGSDYDEDLHHDVETWGGYTYLLFEYSENSRNVDGIYVFDEDVLVGTFQLGDHYTVTSGGGPGGGGDWSHGNGIEATEDGLILLSMLSHSAVVAIDGDPASASFLDIVWSAAGESTDLTGVTYGPPGDALDGFSQQHNASFVDELLWVFDNRGAGTHSRAAAYSLIGTELVIEETYDFDTRCDVQGGAMPVGGGVLGSCVAANDVRWWVRGDTDASWTLDGSCGGGPGQQLNRAIPVMFDGATTP